MAALNAVCRSFSNLMRCSPTPVSMVKCQGFIQPPSVSRFKNFLTTNNVTSYASCNRHMATLNQMHRTGPFKWKKKTVKATVLEGNPQKKGVILKVMVKKPKKPNSANRKCCRVRLSNNKECVAYIPGEGHQLQEHNIVLVEGGRLQDVIGVKVKCVRGKYDLGHVKKEKKGV